MHMLRESIHQFRKSCGRGLLALHHNVPSFRLRVGSMIPDGFLDSRWKRCDYHVFIDLFSGLGGASQAAADHGWHVLRFDNNEALRGHVKNTHYLDIMHPAFYKILDRLLLDYAASKDLDRAHLKIFLWGSPPCLDFSEGYNAPAMVARREGREFSPDMSLIHKFLEIKTKINPEWWCMENVRGAISHVNISAAELNTDQFQRIGPYCLWKNFLDIRVPFGWKPPRKVDLWPSPLRANLRALIPYEISNGVLEAIWLPTLEDY